MSAKEVFGEVTNIPLSPALKAGGLIFVSGQVPTDDSGRIVEGIENQTRLVLDKVQKLLAEAGSSMDQVVRTTVYIQDKSEFAKMNSVYAEYFPKPWPTRSTIECDLMIDIKVEIDAIALA